MQLSNSLYWHLKSNVPKPFLTRTPTEEEINKWSESQSWIFHPIHPHASKNNFSTLSRLPVMSSYKAINQTSSHQKPLFQNKFQYQNGSCFESTHPKTPQDMAGKAIY